MTTELKRTREDDIRKLHKAGKADSVTFLKACFGGELPRDLNIVNPPEFEMQYRSALLDPVFHINTFFDMVRSNWFLLGINLLGSWRSFIGVCATMFAVHVVGTKGYVYTHRKDNHVHINEIWTALSYLNLWKKDLSNTIAHEVWHAIQKHDAAVSLSSPKNENRLKISRFFPKKVSRLLQYLGSEAELAARMFTVVSSSYVQFGFMPKNKYELWACLISQGLTPPTAVIKKAETNPACRLAFKKFPKAEAYIKEHADNSAAGDFNSFGKALEDHQRFNIWDKVFPRIYGDILEVMGDRLGNIRMGHTHNIQLREIFMKHADIHARASKVKILQPIEHQALQTVLSMTAKMMTIDDAKDLMSRVVSGKTYKELNPKRIRIPEGSSRLLAVQALFMHPEMTRGDISRIIYNASGVSDGMWIQRMKLAHALQQAATAKREASVVSKISDKIQRFRVFRQAVKPA